MGSSLLNLRSFSKEAQDRLGYDVYQLQIGKQPWAYKPMNSIGAGVYEIRSRTGLQHRLIYIAKFEEAVYVLHCFEKKTQKTQQRDIHLARQRLEALLWEKRRIAKD